MVLRSVPILAGLISMIISPFHVLKHYKVTDVEKLLFTNPLIHLLVYSLIPLSYIGYHSIHLSSRAL